MKWTRLFLLSLVCAWGVAVRGEVMVGTPKEQVIAEFGPPKGTSASGDREVLTYAEGRVTLREGRVESLSFKGARPSVPKPVVPPGSALGKDAWFTNYEAAKEEAVATNKKILALFTGTDWCPPCQDFEANVATSVEFLDYAVPKVVLLKLDYPNNIPQEPALKAQNEALRKQFGISAYPTFLLMDAQGTVLAQLRTTADREVASKQAYFVEALREGLEGKVVGRPMARTKKFGIWAGVILALYLLGLYWDRNAVR